MQASVSFVSVNGYTSQTQKNDLFAPKHKKASTETYPPPPPQMIRNVKRYI